MSTLSLPLCVLAFGLLLRLVSCTQPNVGFAAYIHYDQIQVVGPGDSTSTASTNITGIYAINIADSAVDNSANVTDASLSSNNTTTSANLTNADANANALITLANSTTYSFTVPINVTRIGATDQGLTVSLYSRPYDHDIDDEGQVESLVYQQSIDMDGNSQSVYAQFDVTTRSSSAAAAAADVVYYLRAEVIIEDDVDGMTTSPGAVVLAHDSATSSWAAVPPADFGHAVNEVVEAQHLAELAIADPLIDLTDDIIVTDEDPYGPEIDPMSDDDEGDDSTGGITNTSTTSYSSTTRYSSSTTSRKGGHKTTTTTTTSSTSRKTKPDAGHKGSKPTTTPCVVTPSPPPPPPCTTKSDDWKPVYVRQAASSNLATIRAKLNYGPPTGFLPIRQLRVTAFGIVNQKVIPVQGKTSDDGDVTFTFPLQAGQQVLVYRVTVSFDSEKYRVSSSTDGKTFKGWMAPSAALTWQVAAGVTKSYTYRYTSKKYTDLFNVQDRILTSLVFARSVAKFTAKLPNVWFPGFMEAGTVNLYFASAGTVPSAYITVDPSKPTYTSAIAHEYGHWFHFLARKLGSIPFKYVGDGGHNFCQQTGINPPAVAIIEGFATAFGLHSLRGTKFQNGDGRSFVFEPGTPRSIENYACGGLGGVGVQDLSQDEGRVAAALYDLYDARVDSNGDDPDRGRTGYTDSSALTRRAVFYDPMRANPQNMQDYWVNMRASTTLTDAQKADAYSVLLYQYAQFPQDVAAK